jgi:hypothetical protein
VSRSRLSLFEVDREALASFSSELRAALAEDDRDALVRMLHLDGASAEPLRAASHAVFVLLAAESHPPSAPIFQAVRSAAKQRALRLSWTSESLALEGRLPGFESLRDEPELARRVDALLDGAGVPWFLRRPGATFGSLARMEREEVAEALTRLDDPPPELVAFATALGAMEGNALCHDTL